MQFLQRRIIIISIERRLHSDILRRRAIQTRVRRLHFYGTFQHSSGVCALLSIYETQKAIGLLKRLFEDRLSGALRLHRVSAPLFVAASSGLNDDLNGVERPVTFDIPDVGTDGQVVHSLAKWKRLA